MDIRVEWLDGKVRTYHHVISRLADADTGQLTMSVPRAVTHDRHGYRWVNIPLANIRWWGEPETKDPLEGEREPGSVIRIEVDAGEIVELRTACGHSFVTCHADHCFREARA